MGTTSIKEFSMSSTSVAEREVTGHAGWIASRPLVAFVAFAYAISWGLWLASLLLGGDESVLGMVVFVLGGFGPAAAAFIVLRATGGSLRTWARAIVRWRVPARYWLYALGLPAALMGFANLVLVALGEPVEWSLLGERILPYAGTFLLTLFFLGAQEEPGWRGFALPRLQERYSPVKATLVLGLIWGVWHVPLYGPVGFVVPLVLAFFYTWVYNETGSVLMAILLHASLTPAQDHLILLPEEAHGTTDLAMGIAYLVGVLMIVGFTRGRLGFDRGRNRACIGAEPTPAESD
jgi:membrane protease YdiL (CAAX protease family)